MSALERFGANAAEKLAPMRRIAVLGAPINMGAWQRGTMMGRRRAHLIMELLHDTGLVGSVDIVELNPLLDERAAGRRGLRSS